MCPLPHDDFDPTRDQLFDKAIERDLRRIATDKALCPPPADPSDPLWAKAWSYFELIYVPALRAYARHLLAHGRPAAVVRQDADEIVREFVSRRLEDGRLSASSEPIVSFRNWLAKQFRCFTMDRTRRAMAQKRRPPGGFADSEQLPSVADPRAEQRALETFTGQVLHDVVDTVLARIARRSPGQELLLRDRLRNGGTQSADLAELVGTDARNLRSLRLRARESFRRELIDIARAGLFGEDDVGDLIEFLHQAVGSHAA